MGKVIVTIKELEITGDAMLKTLRLLKDYEPEIYEDLKDALAEKLPALKANPQERLVSHKQELSKTTDKDFLLAENKRLKFEVNGINRF